MSKALIARARGLTSLTVMTILAVVCGVSIWLLLSLMLAGCDVDSAYRGIDLGEDLARVLNEAGVAPGAASIIAARMKHLQAEMAKTREVVGGQTPTDLWFWLATAGEAIGVSGALNWWRNRTRQQALLAVRDAALRDVAQQLQIPMPTPMPMQPEPPPGTGPRLPA